jgi:hypothetical protein
MLRIFDWFFEESKHTDRRVVVFLGKFEDLLIFTRNMVGYPGRK